MDVCMYATIKLFVFLRAWKCGLVCERMEG